MKDQLRIFLADLTHTGGGLATENMPLGIGLLAAYAKKHLDDRVQIKLFKYPEDLLDALHHEKIDVMGCSTFNWNNNLVEWACEMAKRHCPDVVTIRGGYNFPLEPDQQEAYMRKHNFTDVFCKFEGEVAFVSFLRRLLEAEDPGDWKREPLEGCVFIDDDDAFVQGPPVLRIKELDSIPSPYTSGLMDQFFDGKLTPMIETSRGCPFSCDFCNSAVEYYNKVSFFSSEYVTDEINEIARKIAPTGITNLTICDLNYGMYKRDKDVSLALKKTQGDSNWPLIINLTTGKNEAKRIIENTEMLGETFTLGLAVQSMDEDTLSNIKRSNIKLSAYKELCEILEDKGIIQVATLIATLPGETLDSYMNGIEELIEIGAKRITSHTLQLNYGTVYKNPGYRKQFGYEGEFRLIVNDFGEYGGRKVFDVEEVATFSNTFSFNEYLESRKFVLVLETLFNSATFQELFKYLEEQGTSSYEFLRCVYNRISEAPDNVRSVFDSFTAETKSELFGTERDLIAFYSDEKNYVELKKGTIGGNVLFNHKGILFGNFMELWIDFIAECAQAILETRSERSLQTSKELRTVVTFIRAKLDGTFVPTRTREDVVLELEYDMFDWLGSQNKRKFGDFKSEDKVHAFRFFYDQSQVRERDDFFGRFGCDRRGISRIQAKIPFTNMIRKVEMVAC